MSTLNVLSGGIPRLIGAAGLRPMIWKGHYIDRGGTILRTESQTDGHDSRHAGSLPEQTALSSFGSQWQNRTNSVINYCGEGQHFIERLDKAKHKNEDQARKYRK